MKLISGHFRIFFEMPVEYPSEFLEQGEYESGGYTQSDEGLQCNDKGLLGGYNLHEEFYGGSYGVDSDEGDYTESDDEGPDAYKPGGYHPVRIGEIYNNRYKVVSKLGWGHFSTVWLCEDLDGNISRACYVALKVQKSAVHYTEAAYDEIDLLACARNKRLEFDCEFTGVVSLCDYFEVLGPNGVHVCMVFETMGPNVLTLIKKYDFKGVPLPIVKKLTRDCLIGLDYLHRICGIIHTDLKPENVLVCCPMGIPVSKSGNPLVPLDRPIDATGSHFADIKPTNAPRAKPTRPISPRDSSKKLILPKKLKKRKHRKAKQKKGVAFMVKKDAPKDAPTVQKVAPTIQNDEPSQQYNTNGFKWHSPPFFRLKPSRSDPTLLSFYKKHEIERRKIAPYNHPQSVYVHAAKLASHVGVPNRPVQAPVLHTNAPVVCDIRSPVVCAPVVCEHVDTPLVCEPLHAPLGEIFDGSNAAFKIADLGNACWSERHFSEDIQTRQYRSPEVLVGTEYGVSADIWSLACMVFELVTGDYLFDPKHSDEYPRDEDHLALIIELLGEFPTEMTINGKKSKTFFNKRGQLRHIKNLKIWGLEKVLVDKYRVDPAEAKNLTEFLLPMLTIDPNKRSTAKELLAHPWITDTPSAANSPTFASARSFIV